MTYVVLVILIALWASVLVPPYLKDRRDAGRAFRAMPPSSGAGSRYGSAQRFLPLAQSGPMPAAVHSSTATGLASQQLQPLPAAVTPLGAAAQLASAPTPSNVVQLPLAGAEPIAEPDLAASFLARGPAEASSLQAAWDGPARPGIAAPTSTSAARERRRHVMIGLSVAAFLTLLIAITAGGWWIVLNVAIDALLLGYVMLLVRHRQMQTERTAKVAPIRPPVTEQRPASLQAAPAYLLRSGT